MVSVVVVGFYAFVFLYIEESGPFKDPRGTPSFLAEDYYVVEVEEGVKLN